MLVYLALYSTYHSVVPIIYKFYKASKEKEREISSSLLAVLFPKHSTVNSLTPLLSCPECITTP
jgi:hypothetical protein